MERYEGILSQPIPRLFNGISFYRLSIHIYLFQPLCHSNFTLISFNPVFLSQSILRTSTCICFYILSIYFYFFKSLRQSRLAPIPFNDIFFISVYPSSIYLHHFYLLSIFLYLFIFLCQSRFTYLFPSLSILVVRSSNFVYIVSLITNNYFYLLNREEIENNTANIQGIDQNSVAR